MQEILAKFTVSSLEKCYTRSQLARTPTLVVSRREGVPVFDLRALLAAIGGGRYAMTVRNGAYQHWRGKLSLLDSKRLRFSPA